MAIVAFFMAPIVEIGGDRVSREAVTEGSFSYRRPREMRVTCNRSGQHAGQTMLEFLMALSLTSPVFQHNGTIPKLYTCQGKDVSPALVWSDLPKGTKSIALIVDDPDAPDPAAPKRVWVHWVLYNIPPDATGLPEALPATRLPTGTREGKNDWDRLGYGGPCPPIGRHRYFHKLFALDVVLPDLHQPTNAVLLEAMQGHVLEATELIGTYQKN
jgi:Raf kinase inhibitor-like YbhB/YbcL family protein